MGQAKYFIHFADGTTSQPMDLSTLRQNIEIGRLTVQERVSKDGGPPVEFYLFDELVDLWDVDQDLFGLSDGREDLLAPPSAGSPSQQPPPADVFERDHARPPLSPLRTPSKPSDSLSGVPIGELDLNELIASETESLGSDLMSDTMRKPLVGAAVQQRSAQHSRSSDGPKSVPGDVGRAAADGMAALEDLFKSGSTASSRKPSSASWGGPAGPSGSPRSRTSPQKPRGSSRSGFAGRQAIDDDYPTGLQWAVDDHPRTAVTQVVLLFLVVSVLSLGVSLGTALGAGEHVTAPNVWFLGRGLLLVGAALLGTLLVRKEPITALGISVDLKWMAAAVGGGLVLGILGRFMAPVELVEGGSGVGLVLLAILLKVACFEVFFRGFVTRVLLIGFQAPLLALWLACLIYGLYFLSFAHIIAIPGFYKFYYSVLLFGFGTGAVYSGLYYYSRSVWPSMVAHFLALALAITSPAS